MVVTKVCRGMCGCISGSRTPAAWASLRSLRPAACRSIRAPRLLSRIGPDARPPMARPMARPTAGGNGTSTVLAPLPTTRRTRWPCSSPRSPMSTPVASKIRSPTRQHHHQREIAIVAGLPGGGEHRLELQMGQPQRGRVGRHSRAAHVLGRRVRQRAVDHAGAVATRQHRDPPRHRGRLEPAGLVRRLDGSWCLRRWRAWSTICGRPS
jgi:hypothetical protein